MSQWTEIFGSEIVNERCDPILSFEECKSKYELKNPNKRSVLCCSADKGKRAEGQKRCDWVLIVEELGKVLLVELKGSNLEKAVEQIEQTLDLIERQNAEFVPHGRIVVSRVNTTDQRSTSYKKLEKRFLMRKGGLIKSCKKMSESLEHHPFR